MSIEAVVNGGCNLHAKENTAIFILSIKILFFCKIDLVLGTLLLLLQLNYSYLFDLT